MCKTRYFFKKLYTVLTKHNTLYYKQNLSKLDLQALREIKQSDVLIKKADNCGQPVMLNSSEYNRMIYKHLHDRLTYLKISKYFAISKVVEMYQKNLRHIHNEHYKDIFSKTELKFLEYEVTPADYTFAISYCLIKIHKKPSYPGRLIAGAYAYITTPISK